MGPFKQFRDIPQFTQWGGYAVTVNWDYLEKQLASMAEGEPLEMDPDFQRGHVWDNSKRIRYVEYVLRGGRSARDILWNAANWEVHQVPETDPAAKIVLVDGKQRLEAVRMFLRDEIPAFDTSFSAFEDRMRVTGPTFTFHVNQLRTRRDILQWYIDLNSGGVVHTDDEIDRVKALLATEQS